MDEESEKQQPKYKTMARTDPGTPLEKISDVRLLALSKPPNHFADLQDEDFGLD